MPSLSTHLRRPEAHAGLPFHASCPLCRERVASNLSAEPLVSPRVQAAITVGVLAFSAAAPAGALAADPDEDRPGQAAPEQVRPEDSADSPTVDPGGVATELVSGTAVGASPVQVGPGAVEDDTAPIPPETADDRDAPVADPGDHQTDSGPQQISPPAPPAAAPSPAAPSAPAPLTATAGPPLDNGPALRERVAVQVHRAAAASVMQAARAAVARHSPRRAAATQQTSTRSATVAAVVPSTSPPAIPSTVRLGAGERTHVVRPGESLWSVARAVLGSETSTARLAREVNRLWELNADRIGTGDPDLLVVGTHLRLP